MTSNDLDVVILSHARSLWGIAISIKLMITLSIPKHTMEGLENGETSPLEKDWCKIIDFWWI